MNQYPTELRFPPINKDAFKIKYYYFTVDSRDRNKTIWPTTSEYQIKMEPENSFIGATLTRNYKNVKSIELINAVYPNTSNILQEPYLFVCIPELEGLLFDATNLTGMKTFAKLIPHRNTDFFVYSENSWNDSAKLEFHTAGKRIDRLTVQFRKHNGDLAFGIDAASNVTSLTFKVGVIEPTVPA